jgi:hypothetical protein
MKENLARLNKMGCGSGWAGIRKPGIKAAGGMEAIEWRSRMWKYRAQGALDGGEFHSQGRNIPSAGGILMRGE